ncbi:hypothetical protein FNJ88_06290 [Chryseobacterium sp. SNU WT5]|uniref:hypothetical protein n=1 Tax=Chryseobacterium sp. SNU WT5 TaxID=2594269 RepID=UPI00117DB0FE|nr:hypothetical protein [Chryseobacterium sp. SNU WT5]QDP85191.1 hypothetical protein FNJ88_06290 [Chryseobacterium sp. SNU WT5]
MDKTVKLKENLRLLVGANPNLPIDGIVTKISGDTCSVKLGDFEISDIRLKATADGTDNLLIIPKIGTRVLMLSTDGTIGNLTVIKCDVAEKIFYNENGLLVEIDSTTGKVKLQNNETSIKTLFQQLVDLLKTLKVFTPVGPSGIPLPDSIVKIENFETDFKTLLK